MIPGSRDISQRVFQLGQECYVIYLGSDRDDENPFLRIGNIPDIPEALHKITSRIIITSSFTGNPFQEVEYARRHKLSYLGDVDVIEHFRKFFQSLNLPARDLTDYRQVKNGGNRHTLYFYNNGNIHLNFDGHLLFDLQKREAADRHCLQRCDEIKKLLVKNPLRYSREELNKPGFFVSGKGRFYLYNKEWMALDLENHFFSELASLGIDPDDVCSVFTHVPQEKMSFDHRESLVQHIKRRALRKKDLTILTTRPEIPDHLVRLFPEGGSGNSSPVKPILLKSGTDWTQGNMKSSIEGEVLKVQFGEDNTLFIPFGSVDARLSQKSGWHVSIDRKTLIWRSKEGVNIEITPLRGYPLLLEKKLPDLVSMASKYLGFLHSYLEAWGSRDLWEPFYTLESKVELVLGGGEADIDTAAFSSLKPSTPGLEYIFLSNAVELLKLAKGDYTGTVESLVKILASWDFPSVYLPVLGDLYHGYRDPFILYRISTHKLNPYNLRKSEDISAEMSDVEMPDLELYQSERIRLENLLSSLKGSSPSIGAAGVVSPVQERKPAPLRSVSSESLDSAKKTASTAGSDSVSSSGHPLSSSGPFGKSGTPGNGGRKVTSNTRISFLPLAILLVLLLFGGGIFAFFKMAGPSNGGERVADRQSSQVVSSSAESSSTEPSGTGSAKDEEIQLLSEPEITADRSSFRDAENSPQSDESADMNSSESVGNGADETSFEETTFNEAVHGNASGENSGDKNEKTAEPESLPSSTAEISEDLNGSDQAAAASREDSEIDQQNLNPGGTISSETESSAPLVETERRPVTVEEAQAYLKMDDLQITLVDIHLVSNDIAVRNGYRDLDYRVFEGKDPDWIWSGNNLELPDGSVYEVVKGDTIWFIASRLIRRDMEQRLAKLDQLRSELDQAATPEQRAAVSGRIKNLAEGSLSEQLRRKILTLAD